MNRLISFVGLACAAALLAAPAALADHPQPAPDINKVDYSPIGFLKPGEPVPPDAGKACDEFFKPLMSGKIFNPSGKWNAFDTDMFEATCLPFRNDGDESATDPMGNGGESRYGYCAGASPANPADPGVCPNHQNEYVEYYEATMKEILKDFGVTTARYTFEGPDGLAISPAAIVPGADHPEQSIVVAGHYDQVPDAPASAWDSAEGHAEVIRMAKILADYWKATGTRPSATVKFVPWAAEEDGLLGSEDYVNNVIVPGEEANVRGYWNVDPCAGGYPAYRYGNPADRVDLGIQVGASDEPRVVEFNERAPQLVEQVFERLDDRLESQPGQPEIFVSTAEGGPLGGDIGKDVFIGTDQPVLFSSDWANFIAVGIPFFNPGPEVTGPNAGGDPGPNTPGNPDAVVILHTPLDNLVTMNRYTGGGLTGMAWSEGWMKGMEMCASMVSWGMLQPDQGGAQTTNGDPVAYFEALPNEAERGRLVNFDGTASYQYANPATRAYVPAEKLQLKWDFGDGTALAYGKNVKHAYKRTGTFNARLTVTNRDTGKADTHVVPVTVEAGSGRDNDPPGQDVDNIAKSGSVVACQSTAGFTRASVKPAGRGLRFDLAGSGRPIQVDVFRVAKGRRVGKPRKVASFRVTESFTWNGRPKRGRLAKGSYYVRLVTQASNNQTDARAIGLQRTARRFKLVKPFQRRSTCDLVSEYRLSAPVFGGKKRKLTAGFALTEAGKVSIRVFRGKASKPVRRISRTVSDANRLQRVRIAPKRLRRGLYRIVLRATAGSKSQRITLYARKL